MATNPSKDVMRQPLPQGGTQASVQDLANQSFDPVFRTFVFQLMSSDDGVNLYPSGTPRTSRYDLQAPVYYVGSAPLGAADADTTWTITKFDLTSNPYSAKVATAAAWASRTGATYS